MDRETGPFKLCPPRVLRFLEESWESSCEERGSSYSPWKSSTVSRPGTSTREPQVWGTSGQLQPLPIHAPEQPSSWTRDIVGAKGHRPELAPQSPLEWLEIALASHPPAAEHTPKMAPQRTPARVGGRGLATPLQTAFLGRERRSEILNITRLSTATPTTGLLEGTHRPGPASHGCPFSNPETLAPCLSDPKFPISVHQSSGPRGAHN